VPVHNLTVGDYELTAGDPLVWMEFTKLSDHRRWRDDARESQNPYVSFPDRKRERRGIADYVAAASPDPIVCERPAASGGVRAQRASPRRLRCRFLGLPGAILEAQLLPATKWFPPAVAERTRLNGWPTAREFSESAGHMERYVVPRSGPAGWAERFGRSIAPCAEPRNRATQSSGLACAAP
jgi:hypothetical protein